MLTEFKNYLTQEEKSPLTIEKYLRDVRGFLQWLGSEPLDKGCVLTYKSQLLQRYSVASANSILSAMNCYFKFLERHDCRVKFFRQQRCMFLSEAKELTKAEYKRLILSAADKPRLCLLMQTICSTGIRVSEHRFITVEAARKGYAEVRMKGKSRIVLIPGKLCTSLLKYAKKHKIRDGSIFVTESGKPMNRSTIWAEMKKLCGIAQVPRDKVFPHNLQHLFARVYYSMEHDIVRLSDILGHSSVNTTRIYTMESGRTHRKQIDRLQLLFVT